MQTRPRGANFASSGASNSAIRPISQGISPHYTSPGCQTFFFLKVNGPISHQLFSRNPSRQRVKGLNTAVSRLEVVGNRRHLTRTPFGGLAGGGGGRDGQMCTSVVGGGAGELGREQGPRASVKAKGLQARVPTQGTRHAWTVGGVAEQMSGLNLRPPVGLQRSFTPRPSTAR